MSHSTQAQVGQASFNSFSITQSALGSPLEFEPALGSQELDDLINNYITDNATTQQKRARVVLEFLNSIDAYSYQHPVCLHYYAPLSISSQLPSRQSSTMPSTHKTTKIESANPSKTPSSLKRVRQEPSFGETSSAKRLPGFSILTRDGVDITEYASRGPKTKEQRDHAALMRKLKACAACKRSKQRCDPSHHRPTPSALGILSSTTSSTNSARNTSFSSSSGSRGSVSPPSSLGESFSQSPTQRFTTSAIAHAGQGFSSLPTPNPNLSPSDFTLPDTPFMDPILSVSPTQNLDSELFQFADVEDISLLDYLSQVSSNDSNYSSGRSQDNLLTQDYTGEFQTMPNINAMRQGQSDHSRSSMAQQTHENFLAQNSDRQSALCEPIVSSNALDSNFDVNEWIHPSLDTGNNASHQSRRRRRYSEQDRGEIIRTRASGACHSCKYQDVKCVHGLPSSAALGNQTRISHGIFQNARNSHVGDPLVDSQSQQSQLLRGCQYQDYVLYPDSGDFNMGLETDQIFRDVASTRWPSLPGYSAGISEVQSISSPLSPQQITMHPTLQAVTTADAGYNMQSPMSYGHLFAADAERHSYRNRKSSDTECGYQTVSGNSSRLDADDRLSEVVTPNIQNHILGANDQIPQVNTRRPHNQISSDSGHIMTINDLILGVNQIQQTEASHTQPIPSAQTAPSRQRSCRYITRSSQEDDTSRNQNAGAFDNSRHSVMHNATEQSPYKPADFLERCTTQVSSSGEGAHLASMPSLGTSLMRYTMSDDFSRTLEHSTSTREDGSERKSIIGLRGECLQQTGMLFDPQLSEVVIQNVENIRLKEMVGNADDGIPVSRRKFSHGVFFHLCILMAILILATISLLLVGSDHAVDSISGSFLQATVSLYCNLPEFQVSGTYGVLESIAMEPDLWIKHDLQSEPGLDEASYPYYHGISYSGYSCSESHDLVESWPVIPETGLTAFGADLNYDTNVSQWKDSPIEFHDTPRIYGTPTTTITIAIASPTIMPTVTSVPKSQAVDAIQTTSKASIVKRGPSLAQRRLYLLKHLNRDNILGDIAWGMTSLRLG